MRIFWVVALRHVFSPEIQTQEPRTKLPRQPKTDACVNFDSSYMHWLKCGIRQLSHCEASRFQFLGLRFTIDKAVLRRERGGGVGMERKGAI
jgi:hypothetical protein